MSQITHTISHKEEKSTYFGSYVIGFVTSVILTIAAYVLVTQHLIAGWILIGVISALAIVQCLVQLFVFLHLKDEEKPRWKLGVMLFMLLVLCIIVGGSMWIMHSLNYRMMMTPQQMQDYMNKQIGL